ncbi:MAG: NADH-quinone oxidoreductase subunit C [Candidatus Margulisiibacteriota bacterium]
MNWIKTKNNKPLKISDIPLLQSDVLLSETVKECKINKRPVGFFGTEEEQSIRLFILLADDLNSDILVSSCVFTKGAKYPSLTCKMPSFHMFEREFYEQYGIEPTGHPWLKPIRLGTDKDYPFFKMDGEELHEVAVGPVHAGIIEPGHFRFICHGEKIYHLELKHGYQHKGVEALFVDSGRLNNCLAESIAGDTVIGHSIAYSNAIESLSGIQITQKAEIIREIALELERIAVHIGDLGAISGDIAYQMGNAVFGVTRTLIINAMLDICGNRFGRGLIRVGGVLFDIDDSLAERVKATLDRAVADTERAAKTMFSTSSVLLRLERTGIIKKEKAVDLGLVGMTARSSGIDLDIRKDHPYGNYKNLAVKCDHPSGGDVFARTYIRYAEIKRSAKIVYALLEILKNTKGDKIILESSNNIASDSLAVSMVEGWRGEIAHAAITDNNGKLKRYKIKDPSFNNWIALVIAARGAGISDFPLCNKSFDLSYCGNDL